MQSCPVCETAVPDDANHCATCGWALMFFLSLTAEERTVYQTRLDVARQNWQQRQVNPVLKRGTEESHTQFKQRIEAQPLVAGQATLVLDADDTLNDVIPLQIKWYDWLPNMASDLYVSANSDDHTDWLATLDGQLTGQILVQAHVDAQDQVGMTQLFFQDDQQRVHPVRQGSDEDFWHWVKQRNNVAAYRAYLCADTLKNHRQAAQQDLEQRYQQLRQREWHLLLSSFALAIVGAVLGTIMGYYSLSNLASALFGGVLGAAVLLGCAFLLYSLWKTQHLIDGHTLCALESINQRKLSHAQWRVDKDRMPYLHIRGWAVDVQNKQEADAVYIQVQNQEHLALYGQQRPDIQQRFYDGQYQRVGFLVSLDTAQLEAGTHRLSLKIVSADKRAYYVMPDILTLLV